MRNGERIMRNAKYNVLFGIALVGIMLFAACDNIFDKPETYAPIESGYGRISIDLTGGDAEQESARTVLPSTAFTRYEYTFTKSGSTTGVVKTPDNGYFVLEIGSYTVTVKAYIGTTSPGTLAASGTSAQFTVGSGVNAPVRVPLTGVTTGTQGTFSYAITCPQDATMTITLQKWPDLSNITLNPVSQGNRKNQTLDTGSYLLTVRISKDGLYAGKAESIHIYPSLTTEYTKDFTDEDMLAAIPPTMNGTATALMQGIWTDGNITTSSDEQWFRFTATAVTQYIHVSFGTLTNLSVQLYESGGITIGSQTNLTGSTTNISRSVAIGQVYFIKVKPNSSSSGAYKIVFNASSTPPSPTVTLTAAGVWEDGIVSATGEQWFKFTATAATHYIYATFGTLNSSNGLYVEWYNSNGIALLSKTRLYGGTSSTTQSSLTSGQVYYIKVTPYSNSDSGSYQIAFNASMSTPTPKLPGNSATATALTADVWKDGTVSASGEQWFKFDTTSSSTHYIYVTFGTLNSSNGVYIQVYNSSGNIILSQTRFYNYSSTSSLSVTSGQTYYVLVWPYDSSSTGTYQIAFNASGTTPVPKLPDNSTTATTLTAGTWADGVASAPGEKWFKFTATETTTQYIHVAFGTLNPSYGVYVQVYNSSGSTVGSQRTLNYNTRNISQSVTSEQTYYVLVWPYDSSYTGTYAITFNTSNTPPVPPSDGITTTLNAGVWADGTVSSYGEQWFKFTANYSSSTHYIHAAFGTLNSSYGLYVQVYDSTGSTVVSQTRLYSGNYTYASLYVTSGQTYYIKVTQYSSYTGTYQIAFNTSSTPPSPTITLNAGVWADGAVSSSGEQWFKFTATASTQYIHVTFGILGDLYVQVYNSSGATVGGPTELYGSIKSTSQTLTSGQTYYIKVTANSSTGGDYQITFNASNTPPSPTTRLYAGVWADGTVSASGEQWFKFTATASTNYIHASFGTLTSMYVQVYNSSNFTVGTQANITSSSSTKYISRDVTNGQTYYIKVTPYSGSSGTYQITFNASSTPPSPTTTLTAGVWADGTVSSTGEQWFKFTATSSTHYIHASFGTLSSSYGMNVQVSGLSNIGTWTTRLYSGTTYTSLSVSSGNTYYIKVTPYDSSYTGTYQIAFNTSSTPPIKLPSNATMLTADTWVDGTVSSTGEQWFKFTATSNTQYIHASFTSLNSSSGIIVQVYSSSGSTDGYWTNLNSSSTSTPPRTVISGQTYYIKVTPYSGYSGTYQIAFNTSSTPPSKLPSNVTTLTANTWASGNISSSGEQWFKFTATASTQYIHVSFGALTDLYVQLYDSNVSTVGNAVNVYSTNKYGSQYLSTGQVYYIKVWPYSYGNTGTYRIAFNTSSTPPN